MILVLICFDLCAFLGSAAVVATRRIASVWRRHWQLLGLNAKGFQAVWLFGSLAASVSLRLGCC